MCVAPDDRTSCLSLDSGGREVHAVLFLDDGVSELLAAEICVVPALLDRGIRHLGERRVYIYVTIPVLGE